MYVKKFLIFVFVALYSDHGNAYINIQLTTLPIIIWKALMEIVDNCLREAEGNPQVVFPALGTGRLNYPEDKAAEAMIDAMLGYTARNPATSIKDITITLFPEDSRVIAVSKRMIVVMLQNINVVCQ